MQASPKKIVLKKLSGWTLVLTMVVVGMVQMVYHDCDFVTSTTSSTKRSVSVATNSNNNDETHAPYQHQGNAKQHGPSSSSLLPPPLPLSNYKSMEPVTRSSSGSASSTFGEDHQNNNNNNKTIAMMMSKEWFFASLPGPLRDSYSDLHKHDREVLRKEKEGLFLKLTDGTNTNNNDNTYDPTVTNGNGNNQGGGTRKLWIHVRHWSEGIAAWRHSISELFSVAKTINATLVEPCVQNGRLVTCQQHSSSSATTTIRKLSDVYDLTVIQERYPNILASHQEFIQQTGYSHQESILQMMKQTVNNQKQSGPRYLPHDWSAAASFRVFPACLTTEGQYRSLACQHYNIQHTYNQTHQPDIEAAIDYYNDRKKSTHHHQQQQEHVIVEIISFFRHSLNHWVRPLTTTRAGQESATAVVLPTSQAEEEFLPLLQFHPKEKAKVVDMLQRLNIDVTKAFAAFQWRPEIKGMDHMACANAILESRDVVSRRDDIPKNQFVLLSPLSLQRELQWGGVAKIANKSKGKAYQSLQLLYDNGFHKLEQTFFHDSSEDDTEWMEDDGTMLVVWDMIMASMAETYITCSGCDDSEICSKCNHQGKASKYTIDLRQEFQGSATAKTNTCWPSS